jgi:hypothetical protein
MPKVVFKFDRKQFELIFVRRKFICIFVEVLSPQKIIGSANRKPANRNPRSTTFEEGPQI